MKSEKADPDMGYVLSRSQTYRVIAVTIVFYTIVAEHGSATVNVKLEGAIRSVEV